MVPPRPPATNPGSAPRAVILLAAALPLLAGCDSILSPDDGVVPPIRTDALEYRLEVWNEDWLATEISYTFENRTGGPVYIPNCRGDFHLTLHRHHRGNWETTAWGNTVNGCLSPPIVIDAGETFSDTLRVAGGLPGTNAGPTWDQWDPSGTYRIVWPQALSSYEDEHPHGPTIPLEHRVSNAFVLQR